MKCGGVYQPAAQKTFNPDTQQNEVGELPPEQPCNGFVKPDIVFLGEEMSPRFDQAFSLMNQQDVDD